MDTAQYRLNLNASLVAVGSVAVAASVVSWLFWSGWQWNHLATHAIVEAVGSCAALVLVTLFFFQARTEGTVGHRLWILCGLMVMSLLDLFHAFTQPGKLFVWLHSTAVLAGGALFALVWFEDAFPDLRKNRSVPLWVAGAATLFGILSSLFPENIPDMLEAGAFTTAARFINITGGLLFLAAMLHFALRFRQAPNFEDFLFANLSMLFGVSGILFETSRLWDASWWLWHLLRMFAYLIALGYVFHVFQTTRDAVMMLNRKQEETLADARRKLAYLNNVPAPVLAVDQEFTVQFVNRMGAEFLASTVAEATGKKCYELVRSSHCNTDECRIRQAMAEDGMYTGRATCGAAGGKWVQYTGSPLKNADGDIVGAVEFMADVSELSRMQEVLKNTNDFLENQIREAAENIESASTQILAATESQMKAAADQASAVNETSATVEQTFQSAQQSVDRADQIATMARTSVAEANSGFQAVQTTVGGVSDIKGQVAHIARNILELNQKTQQIGDIIEAVEDIADQSNLLALNAAIEAARAGEAGKGFTVVAGEVKSLAEQSRQATGRVQTILDEIRKAADRLVMIAEEGVKRADAGVVQAQQAGEAIRLIQQSIEQVTRTVEQISAGAREQLAGMNQISQSTGYIERAASQTETATGQVQEAARSLNARAEKLSLTLRQYQAA